MPHSRNAFRMCYGPELTSRHFLAWAIENGVEMLYIPPGRPTQNGRAESLNGKVRDEYLNTTVFRHLFDARAKVPRFLKDYNEMRPHSSLGYLTPAEFAAQYRDSSGGKAGGSAALESPAGFPLSHRPTTACFSLGTQTQDRVSSTVA